MIEVIGIAVTVGGMLVGALVWLVRLEGRINAQSVQITATDKRVDGLEEQIVRRLDRIDGRLDTLLERER